MRENGLLAPHRVGRTEAKLHDGTIITDKVNEMWGTDMTQTITIREGRANVFVAVEHACSDRLRMLTARSRQGVARWLQHPFHRTRTADDFRVGGSR
jgi:hypothetical protein